MPTVKLKLAGWLQKDLDPAWTGPEGVSVSVAEGQTILEMGRQLGRQNQAFRKIVLGENELHFGADVLVVLNGAIVNPHNRSETVLKDGDEVMLLPIVGGG
jgi:thiamine biosynthesis protein ThiS